jgi:hypothetical protein
MRMGAVIKQLQDIRLALFRNDFASSEFIFQTGDAAIRLNRTRSVSFSIPFSVALMGL